MSEALPNTGNQDPFNGNPTLLRTTPDHKGNVQLFQTYDQTGIHIDWEQHPYTSTDPSYSQTGDRRAVIFAGDEIWYLKDDALYDIRHLDDRTQHSVMPFSERQRMFKLTIGEEASFTNNTIDEVMIACGKYSADSPEAQSVDGEVEDDYFSRLDEMLENYTATSPTFRQQIAKRRIKPEPKKMWIGIPDPYLPDLPEAYRLRENRLGVTNEPEAVRERDAEEDLIRSRRREVPMAVQPKVNTESFKYMFRDEQGRPVDERGRSLSEDGYVLDELGRPTTKKSQPRVEVFAHTKVPTSGRNTIGFKSRRSTEVFFPISDRMAKLEEIIHSERHRRQHRAKERRAEGLPHERPKL